MWDSLRARTCPRDSASRLPERDFPTTQPARKGQQLVCRSARVRYLQVRLRGRRAGILTNGGRAVAERWGPDRCAEKDGLGRRSDRTDHRPGCRRHARASAGQHAGRFRAAALLRNRKSGVRYRRCRRDDSCRRGNAAGARTGVRRKCTSSLSRRLSADSRTW